MLLALFAVILIVESFNLWPSNTVKSDTATLIFDKSVKLEEGELVSVQRLGKPSFFAEAKFVESAQLYRMYPLNRSVEISLPGWSDYGMTRIAFSVMFFLLFFYSETYRPQLLALWVMSVAYVFDYFLTYNDSIITLKAWHYSLRIRFTVIRIIFFIITIAFTIRQERKWT